MVDFLKKLFGAKDDFEKIKGDDPMTFSHFNYQYTDRKVPYMTESLEISKSEEIDIQTLLLSSQKNYASNEEFKSFLPEKLQKSPKKIIIDTDLGTDADDVLAILMTLHLDKNDVILLGVTTNYHPTLLRKRIVEEILKNAGPPYDKIPVIAGPSALCGSHREYFHHGNEGLGMGFEKKELEDLWKANKSMDAPEFIYKTCKENPGEITVISIGIPTNIGLCAYIHKDFQDLVGHIVVMGGGSLVMKDKIGSIKGKPIFDLPSKTTQIFSFKNGEKPEIPGFHLFPNHNISGDTLASKFLFSCKCPISLIPHSVTSRHWLEGLSIETLLSLKDSPLSNEIPICGKLLYEWLKSRWGQRGQCPHDPLTVYEAVYTKDGDESFEFGKSCIMYMRGTFIVHEWAGYMTFIGDPKGSHRMAFSPKEAKKWVKWLDGKLIENVPKEMLCAKWDGDLNW